MPDPELGRPSLGRGIVKQAWGSWFVCRVCHEEITPVCVTISSPFGADDYWPKEKRVIDTKCSCGAELVPLQVSGKGTFDVMFGDREHSCHARVLKPVGAAALLPAA